jgi:molecular chaperone HtpG
MEAFREKDLEVLFLDDPLDEFVVEHLREYEGKPFKRAESADIKVKAEKDRDKNLQKHAEAFVEYLKAAYGGRVADVRVSERLVDSPCLLVDPSGGPSVHVERILKMAHKDYQFTRKVFEINPDNPLIGEMVRIHAAKPASPLLKELGEMVRIHAAKPASPLLKELALQLLDNMLLREGVIEDIEAVVPRVQQIMLQAAKAVRTPARKKPSGAKG